MKPTIECAYDAAFRRTRKIVSTWNSSTYVPLSTNRFVYEGWNLVAEVGPDGTLLRSHVWGLDASGTEQGAGGVGGLLATTIYTGPFAGTYFPAYDGNYNVVAYVRASDAEVVAQYEYGPFGEMIRASGSMAKEFCFLFSTKYYDWEAGFYYYGYRYYDPTTGSWLSRDPAGEDRGEPDLYGFVRNGPLNSIDDLGLMSWQQVMDFKNTLEATIHNTKCCCSKQDVSMVYVEISGRSSGTTVAGTGTTKTSGCIETYRYFWWDCYTASSEGGLSWSWKDWGWSTGSGYPAAFDAPDTYPKTAAPGPLAWLGLRDPYHLAMESVVVFTFCGKDGYKHASYASPGYGLQWTWDKKMKSWTGPEKYK